MAKSDKLLRPLNAGEKYTSLRHRLAYYLLIQVYTFLKTSSMREIPEAMKMLIEKAAGINVREAKRHPPEEYHKVLGSELAMHMGETFSSDYHVENNDKNTKVVLDTCGCISSVIEHAEEFNLSDTECKSIFCGSCMGGYKKSTEMLNLKFEGALTKKGCYMDFQTP